MDWQLCADIHGVKWLNPNVVSLHFPLYCSFGLISKCRHANMLNYEGGYVDVNI